MCELACFLGEDLEQILEKETLVPLALFVCGGLVAIVWVVIAGLESIFVARAKEATKRELAAYVAEGSMDPDKAVALMNAGESAGDDEA
jgi:hypothetical protein